MFEAPEDIANWRAAGYIIELMVNAGELVIDGRCPRVSAHARTEAVGIMVGSTITKS